jgi:metallo-beta-lactamase class B
VIELPARLLAVSVALGAHSAALAQESFDDPFPPHRVMGNLYYVGTVDLASFLIATPEGHILINSGFEGTIRVTVGNIEALGFELDDVRIILGSHAHWDHQGADLRFRELTGAEVMIMGADVPEWRGMLGGGDIPIDRVLNDGDQVQLGGTTLIAHRTPGHTKGCTSWSLQLEEAGATYDALIVCSFSLRPRYMSPRVAGDYSATFAKARSLPVDVFLAPHGSVYDLAAKYEAAVLRGASEPNPFVDPEGFAAYVDKQESTFKTWLWLQRGALASLVLGATGFFVWLRRRVRLRTEGRAIPV